MGLRNPGRTGDLVSAPDFIGLPGRDGSQPADSDVVRGKPEGHERKRANRCLGSGRTANLGSHVGSHVWYAANTWDGMLSVGILCRNVFGSVHVQGGWAFDLDHGTLLDNQEVLARVGISQFVQAVRQELRAMVTQEWDAIAQRSAQPGDVIAEHAEENRDRLLAEIQSGQHDPEAPAVFVTGDGAVCLSVWNPSQEYYYDGGDEDWTTLITLHAASTWQNAG